MDNSMMTETKGTVTLTELHNLSKAINKEFNKRISKAVADLYSDLCDKAERPDDGRLALAISILLADMAAIGISKGSGRPDLERDIGQTMFNFMHELMQVPYRVSVTEAQMQAAIAKANGAIN